jgi:hypothetical protein
MGDHETLASDQSNNNLRMEDYIPIPKGGWGAECMQGCTKLSSE